MNDKSPSSKGKFNGFFASSFSFWCACTISSILLFVGGQNYLGNSISLWNAVINGFTISSMISTLVVVGASFYTTIIPNALFDSVMSKISPARPFHWVAEKLSNTQNRIPFEYKNRINVAGRTISSFASTIFLSMIGSYTLAAFLPVSATFKTIIGTCACIPLVVGIGYLQGKKLTTYIREAKQKNEMETHIKNAESIIYRVLDPENRINTKSMDDPTKLRLSEAKNKISAALGRKPDVPLVERIAELNAAQQIINETFPLGIKETTPSGGNTEQIDPGIRKFYYRLQAAKNGLVNAEQASRAAGSRVG